MRRRSVRITLLALLLLIGAGAGVITWSIDGQRRTLTTNRDQVTERLDRILAAIGDIGAAQQAYVAPGQSAPAAFEETATQIQRIYSELEAVQPLLQSAEAGELAKVVNDGATALVEIDSSARGHLRTEQVLWAAEIVFSQARDTRATMTQAVRALQAAEARTRRMAQDQLGRTLWSTVGGAAAIWAIGLIALTWLPRGGTWDESSSPATLGGHVSTEPSPALEPPRASAETRPAAATIDLGGTSRVAAEISRLSSGDAIPGVLARTAALLDASGIILWMGAGQELFAIAAHGYDTRAIAQLGAIPWSADNATAAAWRQGEVRVVRSAGGANGAIVAPMFGPDGCVGVLAAEVRHGRESDADTRAVTAIIAAQLAMVLSAWPGPSTASGPVEPAAQPPATAARLREASGL